MSLNESISGFPVYSYSSEQPEDFLSLLFKSSKKLSLTNILIHFLLFDEIWAIIFRTKSMKGNAGFCEID